MGESAPLIVGYGFVLVVLVAASLFPRAWWVQELARRYGVTPSGPFGMYSRRDHLLRAALSLSACLGCAGLSAAAGAVMQRVPEYKPMNQVASVYMFGFFLLAGVGLAAAIGALWSALFYRPQRPPAPRDPAEWLCFADLLDRLALEPLPPPEWAAFAEQPQGDAVLESLRVRCIHLCGGDPSRFRGPLRAPAQRWAAELRALAI